MTSSPATLRTLSATCLLTLATSSAFAVTLDMTQSWRFYRDDARAIDTADKVPASAWISVNLPHVARTEARLPKDVWHGTAFYKKTFDTRLRTGERAILRFEAAMNVADVWINGHHLGQHLGGYLPFSFDITEHMKASGANEIVVRINNDDNKITGPKPAKDLDYIQYGGLYRGVQLTIKPAVHVTDEMLSATPGGGGVFVTYPKADKAQAVVRIKTEVSNTSSQARTVTITNSLSSKGKQIARGSEQIQLAGGEKRHVTSELKVVKPSLWSPRSPYLYDLKTTVNSAGSADTVDNRVGIRRLAFDKGQLMVNGETMFLRGVNRHQEYPYVGYAISDQANYRDALLIKQAGFDYIRLSHYPHSPSFMKAADELGILVLPGIPGWQYFNPDPAFSRQTVKTCQDMIRRDRNHASVLGWECSLNETDMPPALVDTLHRTVHEEYPGDQAFSAGWLPQTYDIYLQARQHRIDSKHALPNKPLIVSEYGDWEYYAMNAGFNQTAWADLKPDDRSSRQLLGSGETRLLQQSKNIADAHDDNFTTPAFADGYWVMFDYARGYADDLEASGIMSIDRVKKFSFDFFRSQRPALERSAKWGGGPMVSIASHWTAGSSPKVRVYSNADEVELRLNGKLVARQKSAPSKAYPNLKHPPLEFDTGSFVPGELKAIAFTGNKQVATHVVRTAGAPVKLSVMRDDLGVTPAARDMVFMRASLIDAKGTLVPESGRQIKFTARDGYEIVGADTAATEAGIASVLVRVKGGKGSIGAEAGGTSSKLRGTLVR